MVIWWKLIWFPQMTPRYAFICWLVMKHGLLTRDGLVKWGVRSDVLCLFFRAKFRELRHLFFECHVARRVWKMIMEFSLQCNPEIGWEKIVNWAVNNWRGQRLKVVIC